LQALLLNVPDIDWILDNEIFEACMGDYGMTSIYEEIVENLPVLICRFLPGDGKITLVNKAYCDYFGKSRDELIGKSFLELIPQEDHEQVKRHYKSLSKDNPIITYEHPVFTPGGKRWQRWTDQALIDEKGNIVEYQSIGEDVTEKVKALHELRISENKYEVIFETTGTATIITEADSLISLVNREFEKLSGFARWEIEGKKNWMEFVFKEDRELLMKHYNLTKEMPKLAAQQLEFRFVDKKGNVKEVLSKFSKVPSTDQIVASILDITKRKQYEEDLRISEEKYKIVVENSNDYIVIVQDGTAKFLNSKARSVPGFSPGDFLEKPFIEYVHPDDREMILDYHERRIKGEHSPHIYSFRFIDRDGNIHWLEINAIMIEWEGRPATLNFLTDITDRKQSEDSLKIMDSAVKSSINAMAFSDLDRKLTYVNKAFLEMWGYGGTDELMGKSALDLWADTEKSARVQEVLLSDGGWVGEATAKRRDGSLFNAQSSASIVKDENGNPICMMASFLDVTERSEMINEKLQLEKQIQRSQKMEAIGTLAGGIAHDFNNILSGILGYTELALLEIPQGTSLHDKLENVLNSGNRAKELVNQILMFSQQRELERKPINVRSIVEDALKMIRASIPSNIEIFQNFNCDECIIEADATQIHQIVMNLCTNAYHAVKEQLGFIELIVKDIQLDSDMLINHTRLQAGPYVELIVVDTGYGMSPETVEKIFDPYFTTKDKGEGTGLGLSVVHGIVKSLGGAIMVKSIPGKGSSFHVYFPRIPEKRIKESLEFESIPTGHERILIIDDEVMIVDMTKKMLQHLGYEVITRTNSLEALELFRMKHDEIDLVISDVNMPKMTGIELAERLLEIRKDIPIVLGTGYSEMITQQRAIQLGIKRIIIKPLIIKELANTIRDVLDAQ